MATIAQSVRKPAVAGMFYPAAKGQLQAEIGTMLRGVSRPEAAKRWPKALIAPHAGTIYSGPIRTTRLMRSATAASSAYAEPAIGPEYT